MLSSVEDVFSSNIGYHDDRVETISGYLVVSRHLTFLCASEKAAEEPCARSIMVVAPDLGEQWSMFMPPYAGTMVSFAGEATVTGRLCRTGLAPLPFAFVTVRRLVFLDRHGMTAEYSTEVGGTAGA